MRKYFSCFILRFVFFSSLLFFLGNLELKKKCGFIAGWKYIYKNTVKTTSVLSVPVSRLCMLSLARSLYVWLAVELVPRILYEKLKWVALTFALESFSRSTFGFVRKLTHTQAYGTLILRCAFDLRVLRSLGSLNHVFCCYSLLPFSTFDCWVATIFTHTPHTSLYPLTK